MDEVKIVGVACGSRHSFIWTETGQAYSFGNNFYAQLGYDFQRADFKEHQVWRCWHGIGCSQIKTKCMINSATFWNALIFWLTPFIFRISMTHTKNTKYLHNLHSIISFVFHFNFHWVEREREREWTQIPQGPGWLFAGCLSPSLHGLPCSSMLLNHTNPKLSAVELKLALLWSVPLALELNFAYSYHLIQSLSPSFARCSPSLPLPSHAK